ncbi:MAG: hypothetical protein H6732_17360 [Alphaproteobacteria bacterium]|nr:hypothetical protein [Alphaproteobacteria bacterium]
MRDALEGDLRELADAAGALAPRMPPRAISPEMYELGRALFWDGELSGGREEACASCHTKVLVIGMPGPFSIGSGPVLTSRNHLGVGDWDLHGPRFFWDGRVEPLADGRLRNPIGSALPDGVDGPSHAAFLFGGLHPSEMIGKDNDLAAIPGHDFPAIWRALMGRILAFDGYLPRFRAAFPDVDDEAFTYVHASRAMRDYAEVTVRFTGSPWDRFVRGEEGVLSDEALRGGLVFFGRGGCARCHDGPAFSDNDLHNLAVPQFGPGPTPPGTETFDLGRALVTRDPDDSFRFLTPSLRHVGETMPYMHNGVFVHLEDAVRHHLDPVASLESFGPAQVPASYHPFFPTGARDAERLAARRAEVLATLDPLLAEPLDLSDAEVHDLLAFLRALTDPDFTWSLRWVPTSSPTGRTGAL